MLIILEMFSPFHSKGKHPFNIWEHLNKNSKEIYVQMVLTYA